MDNSVDVTTKAEVDELAQAMAESLSFEQRLEKCPVCCRCMDVLGSTQAQEEHLKACLDGDSGVSQRNRTAEETYLVYRLSEKSALVGVECDICLEEFAKEADVARLSCFCVFHSECFMDWFERASNCPVHVLSVSSTQSGA